MHLAMRLVCLAVRRNEWGQGSDGSDVAESGGDCNKLLVTPPTPPQAPPPLWSVTSQFTAKFVQVTRILWVRGV